jgi:hypothetical protein
MTVSWILRNKNGYGNDGDGDDDDEPYVNRNCLNA